MKRLSFILCLGVVPGLATMLGGCYYSAAEEKPAPPLDEPVFTTEARPAANKESGGDWGSIKGQIVFGGGDIPAAKVIAAARIPKECVAALKGAPLVDEEWVIKKENKGVRWVYVWIAPTNPKVKLAVHPDLAKIKEPKVVVDQPCCYFEPHCLAVREGQVWVAKNSSELAHSVKYEGGTKNLGDNVIIPAGAEVENKDLKAELPVITVSCTIHAWLRAWVSVFDHPYYTITDADGKFEIKNAPAGDCLLYIWHEGAGWLHKGGKKGEPITIKAGETLDLNKVEAKP